eukprot:TRINITY_DN22041_c0_g1_i1.p1 TRINITY_DN22041_c0_g1~~TRINITY_DN22041_c0_g1_i1.p1  ORF type:complete len:388 (-),score=89.57 TRINITY_DN22041_c0_g1_i1:210-1373(-)
MPARFRPPQLQLGTIQRRPLPDDTAAIDAVVALYDWGDVLGSGSYATVRQAARHSDGLEMAIKATAHGGDDEVKAAAAQEFNFLREFRHESILSVYAFHETSGKSWLCMELCSNGSAEDYVKLHGPIREPLALPLFDQLVSGLSYLHGKRVVHRDIKPSNLMLKNNVEFLKIVDFGSAKKIGGDERCGAMLTDRGSNLFSAPELMFGGAWSERIDVWSCGLSCFFMCQGCLPFCSQGPAAMEKLRAGRLPDISWKIETSALLQVFIMQCLIAAPKERPPMLELTQHELFNLKMHTRKRVNSYPDIYEAPLSPNALWKERRSNKELLQQLSEHSCSRLQQLLLHSSKSESQPCDAKPVAFARRRKANRGKRDCSKFFTTHSAAHDMDS